MLLKQAQPKPRRREPAVVDHDPADLSASLRELAVRAHRLVRSADERSPQSRADVDPGFLFNLERELLELHTEIAQLERRLRAQNLANLVAYVSALRQRVEEYLD
jgi:hypothetical protein